MVMESWPLNLQESNAMYELITGEKLEAKQLLLRWQKEGRSYTATGYGAKIPTSYMVRHNRRWKRVYCMIYSNAGSLFIMNMREKIYLTIED